MKAFTIIKTAIFIFLVSNMYGQYLETFSIPNKGILLGPCPLGTSESCAITDFEGVDWFINGNFNGFDALSGVEDYMQTVSSGVFEIGGDIDEELCWESPKLDISAIATASFSVDLVWNGHDGADYIDVEYQVDEGTWNQISNLFGGGSHTVDYPTSGNSGSGTIPQVGIVGNQLSIRVCSDHNTASEITTIDNVSVPEVGAMVLPVKWATVSAKQFRDGNQVIWSTYSEINNDRFIVEKSKDGISNFNAIGTIPGNHNSTSINFYDFFDNDIENSISYYRIKQIDLDGKFEYSDVVFVDNFITSKFELFPNPVNNELTISSESLLFKNQQIVITDAFGRIVASMLTTNNSTSIKFDVSDLDSGLYYVKDPLGGTQKLIKL